MRSLTFRQTALISYQFPVKIGEFLLLNVAVVVCIHSGDQFFEVFLPDRSSALVEHVSHDYFELVFGEVPLFGFVVGCENLLYS